MDGRGLEGRGKVMSSNQYPFDFDGLQRGDSLSHEMIISLMPEAQLKVGDDYKWFLLGLRDKIQIAFQDRGDMAYVKVEGEGLRILTHAEQTEYLAKEQEATRRKAKRQYLFQANVDPTQLTPDEKREHERQLIINGRYIQAMQTTDKALKREKLTRPEPNRIIQIAG